jgi:transcriptional regulator with XRE-family HTH domain
MGTKRHRVVVDDTPLARSIGGRIRLYRQKAGLSQQKLAEGRYTKAYISALETGAAKPSMAALNFLAGRLGVSAATLIADPDPSWTRLEADLLLASGDPARAADAYRALLDDSPDPRARAELLRGLAESLCRLDQPLDALRAAAEAAELFAILGLPADRAAAVYWLASAQHQFDNSEEARSLLTGLLDELRSGLVVAPDFEMRVLVALAAIESYRGSHAAAVGYLEEARAWTTELDDRRRGIFLLSLANGYREAGDHEAAIRFGSQALAVLRQAEAEIEIAMLDNYLALSYLAIGNNGRAGAMIDEARSISERLHDDRLLTQLADTEAQVALERGEVDRALALADAAVARAQATGYVRAEIDATVTRARALSRSARGDEALVAFARAADLARSGAPAPRLREILGVYADALAAAGRHEEAFVVVREALASERSAAPAKGAPDAAGSPAS